MSAALNRLNIGASVIAFFGLFEAFRSALFTREFIDSVQHAPNELRGLTVQLRFFQLNYALFWESASAAIKSGYLQAFDAQTELALDDARQMIQEFEEFIEKHGQGRATSTWTAIQIATKRKQLGKLSKRLANAAFQIQLSHSGIVSMTQVQNNCALISSNLGEDIASLTDTVSITSNFLSEKFDNLKRATEGATASILDLIGDLSDQTCHFRISSPSQPTTPTPSENASEVATEQRILTCEHTTLQARIYDLSLSMRKAISEALPKLLLTCGTQRITQSQIEIALQSIFVDFDLKMGQSGFGSGDVNNQLPQATHAPYISIFYNKVLQLNTRYKELLLLGKDFSSTCSCTNTAIHIHSSVKIVTSLINTDYFQGYSEVFTIFSRLRRTHDKSPRARRSSALPAYQDPTLLPRSRASFLFILHNPTNDKIYTCTELELFETRTDQYFFQALKRIYTSPHSRLRKLLGFRRVIAINFISFEVEGPNKARLVRREAIPRIDSNQYFYSPVYNMPPIDPENFAHAYTNPQEVSHSNYFLDYLPKSRSPLDQAGFFENEEGPFLYGLEVVDDYDWKVIMVISCFFSFVMLACSVLYYGGWILAAVSFPWTVLCWALSPLTWCLQTAIQQIAEIIFQARSTSIFGPAEGLIAHDDLFAVLV